MSEQAVSTRRAGQSDAPQGSVRPYTLVLLVAERPGAIDRVVNVLRRRRARMRTLTVGPAEATGLLRVSAVVEDAEVQPDYLTEQLGKIPDVRQVSAFPAGQAIERELVLVKVSCTPENRSEIIELSHHFGAHAVDLAPDSLTLEVTGRGEKVDQLLERLRSYGIRELARSGCLAIARDQ
jgi:acetolactate synthase-1/3 small subunit